MKANGQGGSVTGSPPAGALPGLRFPTGSSSSDPVPLFPAEPPAALGCVPRAPRREGGRRGRQPSRAPYKVLWLLRVN